MAPSEAKTVRRPCLPHVYSTNHPRFLVVSVPSDWSSPRALFRFCCDTGDQERYIPCLWGKRTLCNGCTASHAESDGPIIKRYAYSSPAATAECCHATGQGLEVMSRGVLVPHPTTHRPSKVSGVRQRQRGVLTIK